MKNDLQKELDKKRFFLVKNGLIIIATTISLILTALYLLKINDLPILILVLEYYFR